MTVGLPVQVAWRPRADSSLTFGAAARGSAKQRAAATSAHKGVAAVQHGAALPLACSVGAVVVVVQEARQPMEGVMQGQPKQRHQFSR